MKETDEQLIKKEYPEVLTIKALEEKGYYAITFPTKTTPIGQVVDHSIVLVKAGEVIPSYYI